MRDKWNFLHHLAYHQGENDEIYYNATDWHLNTMKNNKLKSWSVWIFHSIFANLSIDQNHMVSIQSSNDYLFHKVYFIICKWLTMSVLFWNNACLVLNW